MQLDRFFDEARLVIVAGKGGVGKTVLSTVLARAAATTGRDALLVEVEGKDHVATLLGSPAGGYEERVLFGRAETGGGEVLARTITPDRALVEYLDDHGMGRISEQLARAGLLEVLATSTPGIKDLLVLAKIKQLARDHPADLLVVDAPAAGHALTFLRSPAAVAATARVGRINRQAVETLEVLRDASRCQVMLVTLPEETPVNELVETARQLDDELELSLGPIVVNQLWDPIAGLDVDAHDLAALLEPPLEPELVSALATAARFHLLHVSSQQHQVKRLSEQLPLPQLHLAAIRHADVGRPEVEAMAASLLDQLRRLPPSERLGLVGHHRSSEAAPVPHEDPVHPPGASPGSIAGGPLRQVLDEHHIVVFAGTGGVGKTSASAALALAAARRGRRAAVVTIDPARRLADALGLGGLSNEPTPVAGDWPGTLHALMLDSKRTFDELVERYATSDEQLERILENRFYQNFSTSLSGSHELMAMEKLYELHGSGRFDLLVVDTPPTRNALAFLEAPNVLARLMESRLFRAISAPSRGMMRMMNRATQVLLRQIGRVVGGEVVEDTIAFFQAFEGIQDGFYERTQSVIELLGSERSAFVLVASPRHDTVDEARFFLGQLAGADLPVRGIVVNRMSPIPAADIDLADLGQRLGRLQDTPLAPHADALLTLHRARAREDRHVATLLADVDPAVPVARVPMLDEDVHDLRTLDLLAEHLVGPAPPG